VPDRPRLFAAFLLVAAGLMAYAITYQPPAAARPATRFAFDQQSFAATRTITTPSAALHRLVFRSDGGAVSVTWYDSSLASLRAGGGISATLTIDGRQIASGLTGSVRGPADHGPATLRWAGLLPAGRHTFALELSGIEAGAQAPYVAAGSVGVDSLLVTQQPADG
jgi:hypothetical protein